ncbi:MAG: serine hydrolase, partial [Firmicutes bacterium]|nr:serine hydrolase [Bacillota bacterium]
GMDKVNDYMQRHGCLHSALRRKMYDRDAVLRGLTNHVTAYDMAQLLRQIYNKEVPGAEQMLEILRNQQLNGKIPVGLRGLAGEEECAHKTGEDDDITHDVGIVLTDKPFIICFLTNQSPDVTEAEYCMHRIVRDLMLNRE